MKGVEINQFSQVNKDNKIALILGNEGYGLSKKILNKLDYKVKISMSNDFDSLNVSVSAGILIHTLKK